MSDDPTPPLRVKPRLAVTPQPVPGSVEAPSSEAGSTLKLRPPVTPPVTTVPFVHPFLPAPSAPAPTETSPPPENSSPFVPPGSASPKPPLPPPPAPTPKKVAIHIRAPKSQSDEVDFSGKPPAGHSPPEKKPGKTWSIARGAVLVAVLGVGGFFAYRLNFPPAPPLAIPSTAKASAAARAPAAPATTPSDTLNAIAAAPGNAVAQAQATINAGRAASQARIDSLTGGEAPTTRGPTPRPTPAVTTAVALSPGITMAVPDESPAAAAASPAFRSFVAEAKIGGVRANASPPSALINNRLVRFGQPVDNGLGVTIILSAANADTRELTFTDKSGATVTRRY